MQTKITIDQLIELAKIADSDNFDFGMSDFDEDEVYKVVAQSICKNYLSVSAETRDVVYLSSIINLQVKNFALMHNNSILLDTIGRLNKKLNK